jgi:hypothetical protein
MEPPNLERVAQSLQHPLTPDQLSALCARAFGREVRIVDAPPLGGGEFNTVSLVHLAGREAVVLRVAPPANAPLFWHQTALMRREYAVQPFFAPLAPLLPRILMADFTHQFIDREFPTWSDAVLYMLTRSIESAEEQIPDAASLRTIRLVSLHHDVTRPIFNDHIGCIAG